MSAPWLATALKAIPWSVLWTQAPAIIDASRKLFIRSRDSKPEERSQAALVEQIAAQIEQLTLALEVVAARVRLALSLSVMALVIALLLGVWVLLR